jgi:hypothetical protein
MDLTASEEKKKEVRNRIGSLYVMCSNLSPIAYFIDDLTTQFNSIIDGDYKVFDSRLLDAENRILSYYSKDGVTREVAESAAFNHLLVYKVRDANQSEGRYFFHIELANLFIRAAIKKTADFKYHLKKIYNGYSMCVTSPLFFG